MTFEEWWEKEGEDLFLDEPDVEVVMQTTWLAGQASAQPKWRPIETIPRDGQRVYDYDPIRILQWLRKNDLISPKKDHPGEKQCSVEDGE